MKFNLIVKSLVLSVLVAVLWGCGNFEQDFPDYEYSTIYFPYQYPLRTLILGDDEQVDTSNDNNLQFSIGVNIGGMYENDRDRKVDYVIDESLLRNVYIMNGEDEVKVRPLPHEYYDYKESGTIEVLQGSLQGYLKIQLTDEFLNDANAIGMKYVIPVRITNAEVDSILLGTPLVSNPNRNILTDWGVKPQDFTLYGIKYINPWHGNYLYRGKDVYGTDKSVVYREKFVENNEIVELNTLSRNKVQFTTSVRQESGTSSPGDLAMILTFDNDGNCTVSSEESSVATVSGTGKFVEQGDEWGGKKRNVIHLSYSYTDPGSNELHTVNDTLVVRDRNVKLETFEPYIR